MRKALIVVPTFTGVLPRPFRGFMEIMYVAGRTCTDWDFGFIAPGRQTLVRAMDEGAQLVMQAGFDCLITLDDDCFPPFDCIPRLLKHREDGHTFVSGVGIMRGYPHTTTVARVFPEGYTLVKRPNGHESMAQYEWLDDIDNLPPLADVDFCGVPVAVIGREAFERIEKPWFGLHSADGGQVTHDVFFCRKLKAAGFRVLVDTTLKCGHLTEPPVVTFDNRAHARELVGG